MKRSPPVTLTYNASPQSLFNSSTSSSLQFSSPETFSSSHTSPVSLHQHDPSPPRLPVSIRDSQLQIRFMTLESCHKTHVTELQTFYKLQAAQVEADRYQSLLSCGTSANITTYYDDQRHLLMDRVERSLALLQGQITDTSSVPSCNVQRRRTVKKRKFSPTAQRVLSAWYDSHRDYPYPDQDAAEQLARTADISVDQVRKWLSNRRMRSGNTMNLTEIARKRKRNVDNTQFAEDAKRQK